MVLALAQCGGWATRADQRTMVGRRQIDRAVTSGLIERVGRGRYTLPRFDIARGAASDLSAIVSHRSAALVHGWSVCSDPKRPELIVPRTRKVPPARRRGRDVRWRDVNADDVIDGYLTSAERTVVDCARDLPLTESLAVADSALRSGAVTAGGLIERLAELPRSNRRRAELVLRNATPLAANPFESALRALLLPQVQTSFEPQVRLTVAGEGIRPDLVDRRLRIVVEADSYAFHTKRTQLVRDCWRYDELILDGWLVLRFTWDHVMFQQDWVRATIAAAAHQRTCSSFLAA